MLQRRRRAAINHGRAVNGVADGIAGAIGRPRRNGAGLMQHHHIAPRAVLRPCQAHHFMPVHRGGCVGRVGRLRRRNLHNPRPVGRNAHFVKIRAPRRAVRGPGASRQPDRIDPANIVAALVERGIPAPRLLRRHRLRPHRVGLDLRHAVFPVVIAHDNVVLARPVIQRVGRPRTAVGSCNTELLVLIVDFAEEHLLFVIAPCQRQARVLIRAAPFVVQDITKPYLPALKVLSQIATSLDAGVIRRTHPRLVAGGRRVVGLCRKTARYVREQSDLRPVPHPAPAAFPIQAGQRRAIRIGERLHDFAHAESGGGIRSRHASGIIVAAVGIKRVMVRLVRRHYMLQRRARALVNHRAAAAGPARAVRRALSRRR